MADYKTTTGEYHWSRDSDGCNRPVADDPAYPDAPGDWELVSTAAADGALFWTWRREETQIVCVDGA